MIIYLIGMPGAGKSELGKKLSQVLNYQFIDMDEYIEKKACMFIDEIFNMQASFASIKSGAKTCVGNNVPRKLRLKTNSMPFGSRSKNVLISSLSSSKFNNDFNPKISSLRFLEFSGTIAKLNSGRFSAKIIWLRS